MRALETRWNYNAFFICHGFALLLLASWLWQPTRQFWDSFDDIIFVSFNGTLAERSFWSAFWAIANIRMFDIATGLTMMIPLLRGNWVIQAREVRHTFFAFIILLLVMLLLRIGFVTLATYFDLGTHRASPSLLHDNVVRLTELYPGWRVKDASGISFPGDHASVLFIWAMFLSFFASGWRLAIIWGMAILYMLPRLFAGAHWGSDDFVGGLFVALLALSWGCFTPLVARFSNMLDRRLTPYLLKMRTIPPLRKISLFYDDRVK